MNTFIIYFMVAALFPVSLVAMYVWFPVWFDILMGLIGYSPESEVFELWKENFKLRGYIESIRSKSAIAEKEFSTLKKDLSMVLKMPGAKPFLKKAKASLRPVVTKRS